MTATPDPGWSFGSWSANAAGGSVTIHSNTTVTATFTQDEYSLTINKVGNGTVTKVPDQATYHYGDVVALTAAADEGWSFVSWSANVVGGDVTINANTTVTATFRQLAQPTVTTQAVTDITQTTATGNGNITDLGAPNPTEHGVVWSTSLNPTIGDSKTTDGAVSTTGVFTSSITGLTPGTLYHVRAYATNTQGTVYGNDVTFTTSSTATITTSVTNARTGANVSGTGSVAWTNPGNITADDTSYATAARSNATSQYLEGTNYGFAIPSDATINGIVVTLGRYESSTGSGNDVRDSVVSLIKGGTITGNNKAATTTEWPTGSPAAATYGTNSDLWGGSWTPADINASDFGVALSANSTNSRTASGHYMQVTVTYTVTVLPHAPVVTTQAVSPIAANTATGNGTITDLGVPGSDAVWRGLEHRY